MHQPEREAEGKDSHDGDSCSDEARQKAIEAEQQQWKENVVLLFDRQRPGVQQRLGLDIAEEIAAKTVEVEVGGEGQRRNDAFRVVDQFRRVKQHEGGDGRCHQHEGKRWKDAPHAPLIEFDEGELAGQHLAADDAGDQIAGDDEEYIDPDEAAAKNP